MKAKLPLDIALLIFASEPTTTSAQTFHVPRVDVGGEGGLLVAIAEGLYVQPMVGPPYHLEPLVAECHRAGSGYLVTRGLHWDVRPLLPSIQTRGESSMEGDKTPEHLLQRPDGSVVIYPARADGELSGLNLVTVGGGFEQRLNRHASLRIEGSGLLVVHEDGYLALRILAGISGPIGGYR